MDGIDEGGEEEVGGGEQEVRCHHLFLEVSHNTYFGHLSFSLKIE